MIENPVSFSCSTQFFSDFVFTIFICPTYLKHRIWTYDSATPASRNATIYCGAEIMSLDWECKSDRLVC